MDARRAAFLVGQSRRLSSLVSALCRTGYAVSKQQPFEAEDVCFDTQNGALYKAGARLKRRLQAGRENWLLETGDGLIAESPLQQSSSPGGELSAKLQEITKGRELFVQARVKSRGRAFFIEGFAESSFGALFVSEKFATENGSWLDGRRALEVVQLAGPPQELARLGTFLRGASGLADGECDALEAALAALGLPLPGAPIPERLKVQPDDAVVLAARKVIAQQAYKMSANLRGTMDDRDNEFLHDLRVATRRARSALRLFAEGLGPRRAESLHAEMGSIARLLGKVRDLDVFLENLPERMERARMLPPSREWLLGCVKARRAEARDDLVGQLASKRFLNLLERVGRLASSKPPSFPKGIASLPATEAAPLLVGPASKRLVRQWRKLATAPEAAELHRLRILAKRLRYAAEFFRPVFDDESAGNYLSALVSLQDCLGAHQDAAAAEVFLQEAAKEAAATNAPPAVILDLGSLIQVLREESAFHRAQLTQLWKAFRQAKLPFS